MLLVRTLHICCRMTPSHKQHVTPFIVNIPTAKWFIVNPVYRKHVTPRVPDGIFSTPVYDNLSITCSCTFFLNNAPKPCCSQMIMATPPHTRTCTRWVGRYNSSPRLPGLRIFVYLGSQGFASAFSLYELTFSIGSHGCITFLRYAWCNSRC